MKSSPQRRFGLSILANGFARLNTTIMQLIGTPLFIVFWGVDLYGEWLILTTIPAYLLLSDVGFSGVAQNEMSIRASAGDRQAALRVFQAALMLLVAIFVGGSALAALFLWFVPFQEWLNLSRLDHQTAWLILAWFLVRLAANQITGLVLGIYRAEGRNAKGIAQYNIALLGQYTITIIALVLGVTPVWVAALDAVGAILIFGVFWRLGKRLWPLLGFAGLQESAGEIRRLMRPSFALFGCSMSFALVLQGSTTLIGVMLGPQAVVVFNTMRTLTRIPQQMVEMVSNSVWPELSLAHGAGETDTMRRLYRQAIALNAWSAGAICLVLAVVGQPFYEIWTQGTVVWDTPLFVGLLVVVFVNSLHHASTVSLYAVNRHEMLAVAFIASSLLSLAIAVPFIQAYGVLGMALALVVDGCLRLVVAARGANIVIGDNAREIARYVFLSFWRDLGRFLSTLPARVRRTKQVDRAPSA